MAAASVGGVFLVGSGKKEVPNTTGTDELDGIRGNSENVCLVNVFANVENLRTLEGSTGLPQNDTSFFGSVPTAENQSKSCLLINIEKGSIPLNQTPSEQVNSPDLGRL